MNTRQALLIPLAAAALAGCASTTTTTPPAARTTTATVAAAPASSPPSCTAQLISWRDGSGAGNLTTVGNDLGTLSSALTGLGNDLGAGADASSDEAAVQQAAAGLQSDAQTAQADLPPSCVPGLRKDVSAALTDYNRAAIECDGAATEASSGNDTVATSDIYAAAKAMGAGNGKIGKASAAVKAYSGT